MNTTPLTTTTPIIPLPPPPSFPRFDQIVKGDVSIKKLGKDKYRITFSKIGKFLVYKVWDKDDTKLNSKRLVEYLSAKEWVKLFNINNKDLEQKNKHLFTPTTIMEIAYEVYAFVIHKVYFKSCHVVFTVSTKEIEISSNSDKITKLPIGTYKNIRFDIDAPNNGWGVVYNKSNCGKGNGGNVRWYSLGGRGPGSACGEWGLLAYPKIIIWYANPPKITLEKGETYNWNVPELSEDNWANIFKWNGWCSGYKCEETENENSPTPLSPLRPVIINIGMTGDLVLNYSIDLANYVDDSISYKINNIILVDEDIPDTMRSQYVFLEGSILRILFGVQGSCTLTVIQGGIVNSLENSINFYNLSLYFIPDKITNGVINISITGILAENYSIDLANYVVGDKALDISYKLTNIKILDNKGEDIPEDKITGYVFLEGSILRILFKVQGSCTLTVRQNNLENRIKLQFK
jgi:hypothetical protein